MAVWRYSENGLPDTSFNGTGYLLSNRVGHSLILDDSGRILVAGSTDYTNGDMAVWRILP